MEAQAAEVPAVAVQARIASLASVTPGLSFSWLAPGSAAAELIQGGPVGCGWCQCKQRRLEKTCFSMLLLPFSARSTARNGHVCACRICWGLICLNSMLLLPRSRFRLNFSHVCDISGRFPGCRNVSSEAFSDNMFFRIGALARTAAYSRAARCAFAFSHLAPKICIYHHTSGETPFFFFAFLFDPIKPGQVLKAISCGLRGLCKASTRGTGFQKLHRVGFFGERVVRPLNKRKNILSWRCVPVKV